MSSVSGDPANPYLIQGPVLISNSGGRTSAFMTRQMQLAYGGEFPENVHVAFANTGRERLETLRFLREQEEHYGFTITYLEWRPAPDHFEIVPFEKLDTSGKWFAELIRRKQYLPNATMRYCTSDLKVKTMNRWMRSLGYEHWNNAVGLRYDEGHRVLKQLDRNAQGKERYTAVMPLSKARVTRSEVMKFWSASNFDLQLLPHEGNCDLCFLKGREKLASIIKANPQSAEWWIEVEESAKTKKAGDLARFRKQESYAQLADFVDRQGVLFLDQDDEHDAECGLWCGAE